MFSSRVLIFFFCKIVNYAFSEASWCIESLDIFKIIPAWYLHIMIFQKNNFIKWKMTWKPWILSIFQWKLHFWVYYLVQNQNCNFLCIYIIIRIFYYMPSSLVMFLGKVIGSKMQFSLKNGQNRWFSGHFSLNKIVFWKN